MQWPLHQDKTPTPCWEPSWWCSCPSQQSNASASSLCSRWVTTSCPSFWGTSEASLQTYQTTSSAASGPAGYPPTYRPFSPASPRTIWMPRPAVRIASLRPHPNRRSWALCHSLTATHFCSISVTAPARWQHSAPSWPTFAPTPGTAAWAADPPPKMMLHPPSAGTIAAMEPGRKSVLSPAPTTSRETNTADINSSTPALQPQAASSSCRGHQCGIVDAWRNNHILNFYTNIYCCYNEHTDELLTMTKTHSKFSSLLCLH
jgi:hypothetical protein